MSHCGSRGQTVKKVEDAFEGRQVEGGAADAGGVCCPHRSGGARAPSRPAGKTWYSTWTKNSSSVLNYFLYDINHNLLGGTVSAQPRPRSPTHAHTHLTLTHGPAAHVATNHYAFALPRVQVLVGDEQPPAAASSHSCASSVRAGPTRLDE